MPEKKIDKVMMVEDILTRSTIIALVIYLTEYISKPTLEIKADKDNDVINNAKSATVSNPYFFDRI